jgi:uncharacterized membrane protein HdeD (DUF308 family)
MPYKYYKKSVEVLLLANEEQAFCTAAGRPFRGFVPWWLIMIEGALAFVVGLALASLPATASLFDMVSTIGIFFFVMGILWIISIIAARTDWGWKVTGGVIGILIGLTAFYYPLSLTVDAYMGAAMIIVGLIAWYRASVSRSWSRMMTGAVAIVWGAIVAGNGMVIYASSAVGIIGGIIILYGAFRLRSSQLSCQTAAEGSQARPIGAAPDLSQSTTQTGKEEAGKV